MIPDSSSSSSSSTSSMPKKEKDIEKAAQGQQQ